MFKKKTSAKKEAYIALNQSKLETLDKTNRKYLVLAGNLAFSRIYNTTAEIEVIPNFILQQPLQINGGVLACYVPVDVISMLDTGKRKRPIYIASHSNYRVAKSNVSKTGKSIAFFFQKGADDIHYAASIWFFNKSKIVKLEEKVNIPSGDMFNFHASQLINENTKGEWLEASVIIYGDYHDVQNLAIESNQNIVISQKKLFCVDGVINNFDKLEPILTSDYKENNSQKTILITVASTFMFVAIYFGTIFFENVEKNNFTLQKKLYATKSAQQYKNFTPSDLELWHQRKLFAEERNNKLLSTDIMEAYLKALSYVNRKTPIMIDRIEINQTDLFRENGNKYNTKFVLGIKQVSQDIEFDITNALGIFAYSMGGLLASDVEVWDSIITKTVNGEDYSFIVFYADYDTQRGDNNK